MLWGIEAKTPGLGTNVDDKLRTALSPIPIYTFIVTTVQEPLKDYGFQKILLRIILYAVYGFIEETKVSFSIYYLVSSS